MGLGQQRRSVSCQRGIIYSDEAKYVNRFFGSKPFGFCDCNQSVRIIFAKAIIDVEGAETFNALKYSSGNVPIDESQGQLSEMVKGDWGFFENYDDYTTKMLRLGIRAPAYYGENFIKWPDGGFYGLPREGSKSEAEWLETLRNKYNEPHGRALGKQRSDAVPGFNGLIRFIDVARMASDAFIYRGGHVGQ